MNLNNQPDRVEPIQVIRKNLNQRYHILVTEFEIVSQQIDETNDEVERSRLTRKSDNIYAELKAIDRELKQIDIKSSSPNIRYLSLEQDLPKIDFNEIMESIDQMIREFRKGAKGDALLLIQESFAMCGDLCIRRIQETLKQETGDFKHIEIEFSPEGYLDKIGFLNKLADYFNIDFTKAPEKFEQDFVKMIIEKICSSIQGGSILFLEVRKWDELPCQEDFFKWFITEFWTPLIVCLENITKTYRHVKFIAAIIADTEFSSDCLDLPCFSPQDNSFRMLSLPLKNWTFEEIQDWLECYPGLHNSRSSQLANRIYKASQKGLPQLVYTALMKEFNK